MICSCFGLSISMHAQNEIVQENQLPGNPSSEWDISGAGDLSIQGFATDISVNRGGRIHFKINVTDGASYTIKIYRLGYYAGKGARLIDDLGTYTGQQQLSPIVQSAVGLVDCGNWDESAHWDVPATAVSGIYLARLAKTSNGGASHIVFIVRNDASTADILVKTSDATWQAYNSYGGYSLYMGATSYANGHAPKVSYNRPYITRNGGGGGGVAEDWLFNAEYPMVRWLERNGYDITYVTDVDMDRDPNAITPDIHRVLLSMGHDEYWSKAERNKVENACNAGVNLAFFTGNEVYWKTRWENSIDGNNTSHRTLVCYKEGNEGENICYDKCDPLADTWTGLWRSGCNYNIDGCRPENALTGQISWAESDGSIEVPSSFSTYWLWRNTAVASLASGQKATLPYGTLGYEWDPYNTGYASSYPHGRIPLSYTSNSGQVHQLSLYRHPGGALVFGAGTIQWSWGLDGNHDRGTNNPSAIMQQFTVNLLAEMGVQPASLQAGLQPATASTDHTAPQVNIQSPSAGTTVTPLEPLNISGTTTDDHIIAGVEISVDGGNSWLPVNGTNSWSYSWTPPAPGNYTIKVRAFDELGNMGNPGDIIAADVINITAGNTAEANCPCTVFANEAPADPLQNDGQGIVLGMKFRTAVAGYITGVRFYKTPGNTGSHTGELYSRDGNLLASASFTNETASGWQELHFENAIAILPNTTYVVAYHSAAGNYTATDNYFNTAHITNPLTGLADGTDGPNGVYALSNLPAFPDSYYQQTNYWVDIIFQNSNNTWMGTVSSAWENPANWSWGMVPDASSDVLIKAGNPYDPIVNNDTEIGSLQVATGASMKVNPGVILRIRNQ